MQLVDEASREVWPQAASIQLAMRNLVHEQQAEICIGMVTAEQAGTSSRQKLMEAGFSHVDATAALDKCRGDAEKALELLISGWSSGAAKAIAASVGPPALAASQKHAL